MSFIKACDFEGCLSTSYTAWAEILDIEDDTKEYLKDNYKKFFEKNREIEHICGICLDLLNEEVCEEAELLITDHMGRVIKNPLFIQGVKDV